MLVPVNPMRSLFEPLPNPTANRVRNATILGYIVRYFSKVKFVLSRNVTLHSAFPFQLNVNDHVEVQTPEQKPV